MTPDSTPPSPKRELPELTRARRAIVVVDVVESVRLMQEDEAGFIDRWRRFVHQVRTEVLPRHGGRMVKSLGDGMLLEFGQARSAVAASLEVQALAMADALARMPGPLLRIGAHLSEVAVDVADVYGHGVNVAARLTSLAGPGEIVITADMRDELTDDLDASLEDLGDCTVRHLTEPVRAFRVGPPAIRLSVPALRGSAPPWQPAVAVIPFRSYADPGDVVGELLADELIASLSKAPHLRVISRLSTAAFKLRSDDPQQMRALLGCDYVVAGAYVREGKRLRLNVELTHADDGRVAWSDVLSDKVPDIFAGQSLICSSLAFEVSRAVLCEEVARSERRPMPTQESYTLLMAAIHLMHRNSRADFERARELLDHLIGRHPDEALPRAWTGKWYGIRAAQGWTTNPLDDARQALMHVDRALETDAANALAWAVKGLIHSYIGKDLARARDAYQAALAANPSESLAWLYSATLDAWQDKADSAVAAVDAAQRLSPLDPLKYYYDSLSATAFLVAGEHDTSIALARRSLKANRSHTSTYRTLAIAQALSGRVAESRRTVTELLQLDPGFRVSIFRHRYPGRDSAHAEAFCRALLEAGVPD